MCKKEEVMLIVSEVMRKKIDESNQDSFITGTEIGATVEEFMYILLLVMDKYGVVFSTHDFENYNLAKISGIVSSVNYILDKEAGVEE